MKYCFWLLSVLFGCTVLSAAVLMRDGEVMAEIVCRKEAAKLERFAADELAYHLKLITGKDFPIVDTETGTKTPIRIGRRSNLPRDGWVHDHDGTVRITADAVDLAGFDEGDNVTHLAYSGGSARAVYSLLENELGVRWLWPGNSGVYAPKKTDIELADDERSVSTNFLWAWWWVHPSAYSGLWKEKANFDRYVYDAMIWMRRHGFTTGYGSFGAYGHSFEETYEKFSSSNPEMFNLLPDGTRVPSKHYVGGNPKYVTMCVSNPDVEQYVLDRWEEGRYLNLNENDAPGQCVCPDCLAADLTGNDEERFARAKEEFARGNQYWYEAIGSVSNRYAMFVQRVLEKAREKRDIDNTFVIFGPYANYWLAPTVDIQLDERVMLQFTPVLAYPIRQENIDTCKDAFFGWKNTGASVMFRPNTTHDGHNFPLVYYPEFLEVFDFCAAEGMFGSNMDTFTGALAGNALTLYMIAARHGHGMDMPLEDVEEEFFSAFYPADQEIREYWQIFRQATLEGYDKFGPSHNFVGNDFYGWFYKVAPKVFNDEMFERAAALLARAKEKAAGDDALLARIDFLETGMTDARLTLATELAVRKYRETDNADEFIDAVRKLDSFRDANEYKIYANIGRFIARENDNWPRNLAAGAEDSIKLDLEICFDASASFPNAGVWHPASPETQWEELPAGIEYEKTHGKPYKGAAWYRAEFTLSAEEAKQVHTLDFGAVDGSGVYYINGREIHRRPWPYMGRIQSWLDPFSVKLPEGVLKAGKNIFAARVEKPADIGTSGIWKAVCITPVAKFTPYILAAPATVFDPDATVATNGQRSYSTPNILLGKRMYPHPHASDGTTQINGNVAVCTTGSSRYERGGIYVGVSLDQAEAKPIIFSIESRAVGVMTERIENDYYVCIDVIYTDGTVHSEVLAPFGKGTFPWRKSGGIFLPEKPVKKVNLYAEARGLNGKVEFRNPELYVCK